MRAKEVAEGDLLDIIGVEEKLSQRILHQQCYIV